MKNWQALVGLSHLGFNFRDRHFFSRFEDLSVLFDDKKPELLNYLQSHKKTALNKIDEALLVHKRFEKFLACGGRILGERGYHELDRLVLGPQPPMCAYVRGEWENALIRPRVAIVGSRHANKFGCDWTYKIAKDLAANGVTIISGGALGIDCASHLGAIAGGGHTLAVLGSPINSHGDERPDRLLKIGSTAQMVSVTPYGPWVAASKGLFVARNQYVAALADAVIVVQGRLGSGALHTAKFARNMGIPIWAPPGAVSDPLASAPNELLSLGHARALTCSTQILHSFQMLDAEKKESKRAPKDHHIMTKPTIEDKMGILTSLYKMGGRAGVDELLEKVNASISSLQTELMRFELEGLVRKEGAQLVLIDH